MTRFWSSLRCLLALWLWSIFTVFAPSAAFGYEFQQRASIGYDGTIIAVSGYDTGKVLAGAESARQSCGDHILFATFAKFLAAEETVPLYRAITDAELSFCGFKPATKLRVPTSQSILPKFLNPEGPPYTSRAS